jgi:hypothetical protein
MNGRAGTILTVSALAVTLVISAVSAAPLQGDSVPPEIAGTALGYTNALVSGDVSAAWNLLSSQSRSQITRAQWQDAFGRAPMVRKPPANALVKAFAAAETAPVAQDVLLSSDEALVQVGGSVQITQQLVLVKQSDGWRVDLAASDRLNSLEAAQLFLDAVRAEAGGPAAQRSLQPQQAGLAIPGPCWM